MISDPHVKALVDVLVGLAVRELKKQKPEDNSGYCRKVPLMSKDWNDDDINTGKSGAT